MEHFQFATAARIVFGTGEATQLGCHVAALGQQAYVLSGASPQRVAAAIESLAQHVRVCGTDPVPHEPTVAGVQQLTDRARAHGCDVVVAIGGGSVIDAGKAVACLAANPGAVSEYLEVVGAGKPLDRPGVPCVAVPTTAGTGAEVTRNAVLRAETQQVKVSLRSPHMLPRLALVDPALTYSCPPRLTANAGLDALTQLIEAFVSHQANVLTDAICRAGLRHALALPRAVHDGSDREARADMALASLFSGLALANAKLGAVHGFAGPLGGRLGVAHGAVCARLLPFVTEANLAILSARPHTDATLTKYTELAQMLTGHADARPADCVAWLRALCVELDVGALPMIDDEEIAILVSQAGKSSSMKGNPVALPDDVLHAVLSRATQPGW
jgi:alcohol dehydrogenase class IV